MYVCVYIYIYIYFIILYYKQVLANYDYVVLYSYHHLIYYLPERFARPCCHTGVSERHSSRSCSSFQCLDVAPLISKLTQGSTTAAYKSECFFHRPVALDSRARVHDLGLWRQPARWPQDCWVKKDLSCLVQIRAARGGGLSRGWSDAGPESTGARHSSQHSIVSVAPKWVSENG